MSYLEDLILGGGGLCSMCVCEDWEAITTRRHSSVPIHAQKNAVIRVVLLLPLGSCPCPFRIVLSL